MYGLYLKHRLEYHCNYCPLLSLVRFLNQLQPKPRVTCNLLLFKGPTTKSTILVNIYTHASQSRQSLLEVNIILYSAIAAFTPNLSTPNTQTAQSHRPNFAALAAALFSIHPIPNPVHTVKATTKASALAYPCVFL